MPLPLVKLFWVGKVLKYPFVALVETFREYRRKVRVRRADRIDRRGRDESRHFFQHPLDSLRDRRFWIKCVTNGAELSVHMLGLLALGRNGLCRLELGSYVVWQPHHTHEHALYACVQDAPWGTVFRRCGRYLRDATRLWPHADAISQSTAARQASPSARTRAAPRVDLLPAAAGRGWRRIGFDGVTIAVHVGDGDWQGRSHLHQRPGGSLRLILSREADGRVRACVLDDHGAVLKERIIA